MVVFKRFLNEDTAVTSIEYALIAALIAVAIIDSVTGVGQKVQILFQSISAVLP
jgi:pilus assembly protein Flp/PilA